MWTSVLLSVKHFTYTFKHTGDWGLRGRGCSETGRQIDAHSQTSGRSWHKSVCCGRAVPWHVWRMTTWTPAGRPQLLMLQKQTTSLSMCHYQCPWLNLNIDSCWHWQTSGMLQQHVSVNMTWPLTTAYVSKHSSACVTVTSVSFSRCDIITDGCW